MSTTETGLDALPTSLPDLGPATARMAFTDAGCWVWTGPVNNNGYASIAWQGKMWLIHRASYAATKGAIPASLVIDHLCGNRSCAHPDHLEAVTVAENVRRTGVIEANAVKKRAISQCPQGHVYDDANTYVGSNGRRGCRTCRIERSRNYSQRSEVGGKALCLCGKKLSPSQVRRHRREGCK